MGVYSLISTSSSSIQVPNELSFVVFGFENINFHQREERRREGEGGEEGEREEREERTKERRTIDGELRKEGGREGGRYSGSLDNVSSTLTYILKVKKKKKQK